MIIAFIITTLVLSEAVGFLAYKVFTLNKSLNETAQNLEETAENLNSLAECVLKMAKHSSGVEVINTVENPTDFTFPNKEGF